MTDSKLYTGTGKVFGYFISDLRMENSLGLEIRLRLSN
jgi:hypothetical protein